jgi:DNA-binding response OmpR family regulator
MAKIMVVDDDPDVVDACRLILEKVGHEVVSANNRKDGMEKIQKSRPELLILDVMMEEADDGIQLARELRLSKETFPILMLTSISKVLGMDFSKDNEMIPVNEFVEKPVEPDALIKKVEELLKKKGGKK